MKKSKRNINYDVQEDVLYLGVKRGLEEEFVEVSPGVSVELNRKGEVIGIEIINASRMLKPLIKSLSLPKQVLMTVSATK